MHMYSLVNSGTNVIGQRVLNVYSMNSDLVIFWLNQDFEIPCYELIRNRIRDHFTQNWYAFISNSSKLAYYCQFKK